MLPIFHSKRCLCQLVTQWLGAWIEWKWTSIWCNCLKLSEREEDHCHFHTISIFSPSFLLVLVMCFVPVIPFRSFSINTISNCSYVFCEGLMRTFTLCFRCSGDSFGDTSKVFCLEAKKLVFPPSFCSTSTSGANRLRGCYRLTYGLRSQGAHAGPRDILGDLESEWKFH